MASDRQPPKGYRVEHEDGWWIVSALVSFEHRTVARPSEHVVFDTRDEAIDACERHKVLVTEDKARAEVERLRKEFDERFEGVACERDTLRAKLGASRDKNAKLVTEVEHARADAASAWKRVEIERKDYEVLASIAFDGTHPWRVFDNTGPAVACFRFECDACDYAEAHAKKHGRVTRVVRLGGHKRGAPVHVFEKDGSGR